MFTINQTICFRLTWINAALTFATTMGYLAYVISTDDRFWSNFTAGKVHLSARGLCYDCPGLIPIIVLFLLAFVTLAVIQFTKAWDCCSGWCKNNCFPMTQKTRYEVGLPVLPVEA